jgi:hypothetical protein
VDECEFAQDFSGIKTSAFTAAFRAPVRSRPPKLSEPLSVGVVLHSNFPFFVRQTFRRRAANFPRAQMVQSGLWRW